MLTPPISPPGTTPRIVSREASPGIRLFVPRWIGSGGLAIIGGAFAGIVIAVLFQPTVSAAPTAGAVTITSDPPGLALRVDGLPRGVTPLATMLPAGSHRVRIERSLVSGVWFARLSQGGQSATTRFCAIR